ncbi:MAG: hypothetical protein ABW185_24195 [Sedimenticola sp.]
MNSEYSGQNVNQPRCDQPIYANQASGGAQNQGPNYVADLIQQMQTQMNLRFTALEQNMSKLNNIEKDISLVRSDVIMFKQEQSDMKTKVCECQQYCESINSVCDDFISTKVETADSIHELNSENKSRRSEISDLRRENSEMRDKLLEIQSRSMSENLLFFGIDENRRGNRDSQENTEAVLKDFLKSG